MPFNNDMNQKTKLNSELFVSNLLAEDERSAEWLISQLNPDHNRIDRLLLQETTGYNDGAGEGYNKINVSELDNEDNKLHKDSISDTKLVYENREY